MKASEKGGKHKKCSYVHTSACVQVKYVHTCTDSNDHCQTTQTRNDTAITQTSMQRQYCFRKTAPAPALSQETTAARQ